MAVMTRMVGLPAYTYKVRNTDFLNKESDKYVNFDEIVNITFQNKYVISIENHSNEEETVLLELRVKEYLEQWRRGSRDPLGLSAVYKIKCSLDKVNKIFTIHSGNHQVQEVIKGFIISKLNCSIENYRIKEHINQSWQIGNASFKTALLLDFTLNRLKNKGISQGLQK
ncbi:hypothetical protein AAHB94_24255 [Bacillus toyonensis]